MSAFTDAESLEKRNIQFGITVPFWPRIEQSFKTKNRNILLYYIIVRCIVQEAEKEVKAWGGTKKAVWDGKKQRDLI